MIRCPQAYFEAKMLAPRPTLTSDTALYLFNPVAGARYIQVDDTPDLAPLETATQGVRLVPGIICPKCGGPKTAEQGYCPECNRAHVRAWLAVPENRERRMLRKAVRRASKEVREAAPDRKEYQRKYFDRNRERLLAKARLPENKAKRYALLSADYQTPGGNLRKRLSVAIRGSLKGSGKRATWPSLVGYTVAELRQHIERQFGRGMGWHNMAKWHIDHIVPLSSFTFETADDPGFKAAWALTNLRPLWGPDNIRKQARREHLL